jgi:hypothetical protein
MSFDPNVIMSDQLVRLAVQVGLMAVVQSVVYSATVVVMYGLYITVTSRTRKGSRPGKK